MELSSVGNQPTEYSGEYIPKETLWNMHRTIDDVITQSINRPSLHENEVAAPVADVQQVWNIQDTRNSGASIPEEVNQYYTMLAKAHMIPDIVTSYQLFTERADPAIAMRAFNGTASVATEALGEALRAYDTSDSFDEQTMLSGAIQEITFPMLINFDEDGRRFAFPASFDDDRFRKIDMFIMHRHTISPTEQNLGFRACAQIKSVITSNRNDQAPKKGFCLYGSDIHNQPAHQFQTSRSLVSLFETGRLTSRQKKHLKMARQALTQLLDTKLAHHPGEQLHQ